ncbi:glycosyltransferase family 39 protein [Streptomyces sp. RY43-2]|uniref:Glycosyltransferase family 39 protein n=1 Tax=Streptomyces macrolidinus TaxID=2952607 RepID=A0ABT0Z601_9ACTN|nr:glycosyltransferase family 39 protein [Streptomyces macrolidinus]MCN9239193.1 glycosyltransferase family 39 protein [Streptomyces macrolidinus]
MNRESEKRAERIAVLVPAVLMFTLGLWGLDRGGMWRDEAVTFQVARRSTTQIWHLLGSVDAVHGLYYLLMHLVLAAHADEMVLRLPSVCGAAAAAGLVAALGTRLARPRVGLWAGLLYAITPMVGHYAQEGRSYALVAAGVAGATLLLVRAVRGGSWWPYGVVLALTCVLHEFAVLVLPAHACTLALARVPGRVRRGWLCAAVGAVVVLLPLMLVSQGQAAQVAWLTTPDGRSVEDLLRQFTGPDQLVVGPYVALMVLGLRAPGPRREVSLTAVALPLLVVPPALLMGVSQLQPLYDDRYVLYALAGAPLLAAAGAERLARALGRLRAPVTRAPRAVPRRAGALLGVLAVGGVLVVQLPLLQADRSAANRPDDLAADAAAVARRVRSGDPVLFLPSLERRAALAYPADFRGTRDVALQVPAAADGSLYGREVRADELRRRLGRLRSVWVVCEPSALQPSWTPWNRTERAKLAVLNEEFVPRREYVSRGITLRLYVRRAQRVPVSTSRPPGAGTEAGSTPSDSPSISVRTTR